MTRIRLPGIAPLAAVALTLGAIGPATPVAGQNPTEIWREEELGEGILGFVTTEGVNPSSYANVLVFWGTDATLVVDTQDRPGAARRIAEVLRVRGLPPVRWIVNTHYHSDHTLGNAALLNAWPEAELVAHPATRDTLAASGALHRDEQVGRIRDRAGRIEAALDSGQVAAADVPRYEAALVERRALADELGATRIRVPDAVVAERRSVDLGGRVVEILHPGPAHTRGDLVVWDPERGFLAAGDLLEEAPLWLDGADVAGWAAALDRLTALGPVRVLPSHGRVRPDAALLWAHHALLDRAVRVATMEGFGSDAAIVGEFEDLRDGLRPYGVEDEAFDAYVVEVVRRLRGEEIDAG